MTMQQSTHLSLPYIAASQAQKHITHNEALKTLDNIVHLSVESQNLTTPPNSPIDGARFIIGENATGQWAGKDNKIAVWQDNGWIFYTQKTGWRIWVEASDKLVVWDGSKWLNISGPDTMNPTPLVGINATADSTNRLSLSSPASLFSHEGAGHQVKVNKASLNDSASFLFQNNWSGRAEIGLTGDDDFHFKVSADGSNWIESIIIDKDNGAVSFPEGISNIHSGPIAGFRNYMINGGFSIWQRGENLDLSWNYKADRWNWFNVAGDGAGTISKSSDVPSGQGLESSLKLSLTSLPSTDDGFRQIFESSTYKQIEGKIVTLSCWVKGPSGATITVDIHDNMASIIADGTWQKIVHTATIPSGLSQSWVGLFRDLQAVGDYYATGFQLELGKIPTPYELKPLSLELSMCRYYFRRYASEQNVADLAYSMRITPSQSGSGPFDYNAEI